METIGIAVVFLVMLAAPCAIALRSSQMLSNESDPLDALEPDRSKTREKTLWQEVDRPLTLAELAIRAEGDALAAQEFAREAQRAALAAAAHAAKLRADAAIEAARMAEIASRDAQIDYLPGDHPSLDFPRSRQRRRAA